MARLLNCSRTQQFRRWGLAGLTLLLLLGPLLWAADVEWSNPRADWWRLVRDGVSGYSAVEGLETGELIQASGEFWRQLRNGPVSWLGGVMLGGMLGALALFYLVKGPIRLAKSRTGMLVPRWSRGERLLHWTTALLFITLALTGLSILYGRRILIPLMGHEPFSATLIWVKYLHNVTGPLFFVCLVMMTLRWFRDNLWRRIDWEWFKSLGGMLGRGHPPAGRMNAGEKAWFWLLITFGAVVSVSGIVLDLPVFGLEREWMQLSHLLHVSSAILVMAGALGHIYLGTLGTEGALEGMVTGSVDLSWARQHHDVWLKEAGLEPMKPPLEEVETHQQRPTDFFRPSS